MSNKLSELTILIRGAGEVASAAAHRLARSRFKVCLTDIPVPLAVHRGTTFCEAIFEDEKTVEGITAKLVKSFNRIPSIWKEGKIPIVVDPDIKVKDYLHPQILIDATMLKKNLGINMNQAPLVIGIGPGFTAGKDVHAVVESYHNENLGKVILQGSAEKNTGIPLSIGGYTFERALHAPIDGKFVALIELGEEVAAGDVIGHVGDQPLEAEIGGLLRAILRSDIHVEKGTKLAEIDPEGTVEVCYTIRAKMRAIAGGVLEAILMKYNN